MVYDSVIHTKIGVVVVVEREHCQGYGIHKLKRDPFIHSIQFNREFPCGLVKDEYGRFG